MTEDTKDDNNQTQDADGYYAGDDLNDDELDISFLDEEEKE